MRKIGFLVLFGMLILLPAVSRSQEVSDAGIALRMERDGQEVTSTPRVLLAVDGHEAEAGYEPGRFFLPALPPGVESIGVVIEVDGHRLELGQVYLSKFQTDWRVILDEKPFDRDRLSAVPKAERPRVKLLFAVRFESQLGDGTELVSYEPIRE